jgi:energy-coupling factor transporter ATP-binding protein EcfA2
VKKFTVKPRLTARNIAILGVSEGKETDWTYLGRLAETGPLTDIRVDVAHPHVVAIFGKRGSGKSYTMGSMLEGLCTLKSETCISKIQRNMAILLLDTLGIFQWTDISLDTAGDSDILKAQRAIWRGWNLKPEDLDVQVWIPKGTRNEATPASHKEFAIRTCDFTADDWGYLLDLNIYQDRMGQLLNDAYIKVTLEGWKGEKAAQPPKTYYSLEDLINCIKFDTELSESYQPETQRAVIQQLTTYHRNPLFDDQGTPLSEMLVPGRMNVLVMSRMSGSLRLVILSALVRRLMDERMVASEMEKNLIIRQDLKEPERRQIEAKLMNSVPPTWIALDEAQNILPSDKKTTAGEMLIRYVREGRNYGLSFMVATQQPTAIDNRLLAQVDTLITHKLTVQSDIDYVRRNLKSNMPEEVIYAGRTLEFDGLLRSLDVGQALVSNTESERSAILDIRPRISVHGGF